MGGDIPIRLLPPLPLIPHYIDDLATELILAAPEGVRINEHIATALQPHLAAEEGRELDEDLVPGGRKDAVEVVARGGDDAGYELGGGQGSWRGRGRERVYGRESAAGGGTGHGGR